MDTKVLASVSRRGLVLTLALSAFVLFGVSRGDAAPGDSLGVASIPNLRDWGDYETSDGKTVVGGLVYRSNQLSGITPADMGQLAALKLRNAYDLRTAVERERRPEELPYGVNYVVLDVLADSPQAGPAQLEVLMQDYFSDALGIDPRQQRLLRRLYLE